MNRSRVPLISLNQAGKQIVLIAYMTGILWLRRNPISLLFSAVELTTIVYDLLSGSDNPTGWNSRITYKDYIDK